MISFKKYIDIVSAVGGAAVVATRDLIARLITDNFLIPTGTVVTMTSADEVKDYFGAASDEYARALWYFGYTSKQATSPKKISFYRWSRDGAVATVVGGSTSATLTQWQAITAGDFYLTIGGVGPTNITGIDFSGALSLSDVAGVLQTAIRAAGTGATWDNASVTYDSANRRFILEGGSADGEPVVVSAGATAVFTYLNWAEGASPILNARWSDSVMATTAADNISASAQIDDNFGTFRFMVSLTEEEITEVATWNKAQNVMYMFMVPVLAADAATISGNLITIGGAGLTLVDGTETAKFPEMLPMAILAATDYERDDASQNYMFQSANLEPLVSDTTTSNAMDALRVNYYGVTQKAGKLLAFYQQGFLCGGSTDPIDMNVYANEMWLKDRIGAELMNMLLALTKISANRQGRGTVLAGVQVGISQALKNGVISIGKPLSATQKAYITGITGSATAWRQVQDSGYWVDVVISSYVEDSITKWKATYTLVYSKDDAIRKVIGADILI